MTNAIGKGTKNLIFNAPEEWAPLIGKAVYATGKFKSASDLLRSLIIKGAQQEMPALAEELSAELKAREQLVRAMSVLLLCVFCHFQFVQRNDDAPRAPRAPRVSRVTTKRQEVA